MDKILSGLLFPQKQADPQPQVPSNTILIDTSIQDSYISVDYINKSVYNKFIKDYSKFTINDNIVINITSMGGDLFYILLIANIINKHKGNVVAYINKYCMGGALLIALSCNYIRMAQFACISCMEFYDSYIPIDKCYNLVENISSLDILPEYFKSITSNLNITLKSNRVDTERHIYRLLERNYDRETLEKILDNFYRKPIKGHMFKEDIPAYLNIVYDGIQDDQLSIDSGLEKESLD